MSEPVIVIGLGAEGLSGLNPRARDALRNATFIAGGQRHLGLIGPTHAETYRIGDNIETLLARLAGRTPFEKCVVLASGDPLFYGIGCRVVESLGQDAVLVEPAISSMQIAFARLGMSWHDATVASVHGRPLRQTLFPLLGKPKIGLFTRDGCSPGEIAEFFLERGLLDYDAWVCEDLNTPNEAVLPRALPELVGNRYSNLNIVVLVRNGTSVAKDRLRLDDDDFACPSCGPIMLTHRDVRALVVRRLCEHLRGPIWDIGAGIGGVSVELARAAPESDVVAVEATTEQLEFLKINRDRFHAYNIRIVAGDAPECLRSEDSPSAVFLGGSRGRITEILELVSERIQQPGRLVANFVGFENLTAALDWLRRRRWNTELTQVQILEGRPLADLTTLVPQRPVWILSADPPEQSAEGPV
jgi:precorrin-6Y C5,15-methyltransferase (decarboxylating)